MKVFCGESLCKKLVAPTPPRTGPWPVRCGACRTALYPADLLARLPPNELEPSSAELMTERGGKRVAVSSKDLQEATATIAPADDADVDRILAMVELDPAGAEARRARRRTVSIAGLVLVVVVAIAAVVLGTR